MYRQQQAKMVIPEEVLVQTKESPTRQFHINHAWDRFNGLNIINAAKDTYVSWKASNSKINSAANALESGLAKIFGPLESMTESVAERFPTQAETLDTIAATCIDKAETGIEQVSHVTKTLSHVDVKSFVGTFVMEGLDEVIIKLENVLDFLSPEVTIAPVLKSTERFTQTPTATKPGSGSQGKAAYIVPKVVKLKTTQPAWYSVTTKDIMTGPVTFTLHVLRAMLQWMRLRTGEIDNKGTSMTTSPQKPGTQVPARRKVKVGRRKQGLLKRVMRSVLSLPGVSAAVSTVNRRLPLLAPVLSYLPLKSGKAGRGDAEKRKHCNVDTQDTDSDSLDFDLDNYDSEEDQDWQPRKKDMQSYKEDLENSLEYLDNSSDSSFHEHAVCDPDCPDSKTGVKAGGKASPLKMGTKSTEPNKENKAPTAGTAQ